MSTIAFYVSGHGLGHISRQIEVLNLLHVRRPDLRLVVRTPAPSWLIDLTMEAPAEVHRVEVDTGVVQIDSLRLDEAETIRRAAVFHRTLSARARAEAAFLTAARVRLIVSDIPALAFAAAHRVDVPAIAVANFTWDWIYQGYGDRLELVPDLVPSIRAAYATAAAALRLPLAGGFEPFHTVIDVPFIARRARKDRADVRRVLRLPQDEPLVLVSFGGYGLQSLDWEALARLRGYGIIAANGLAGAAANGISGDDSSVHVLEERQLYGNGIRYEDLVSAVDVVVTKPGYGIISECIANRTAVLYTSRGRFIEYDVLTREMPRYLRCAFIDQDDLIAGRWQPSLDALLAQPAPPEHPRVDGAEVVAGYILERVEG